MPNTCDEVGFVETLRAVRAALPLISDLAGNTVKAETAASTAVETLALLNDSLAFVTAMQSLSLLLTDVNDNGELLMTWADGSNIINLEVINGELIAIYA